MRDLATAAVPANVRPQPRRRLPRRRRPRVIGTLVPLADNDAQTLFGDLHRELRAGFTPAEALRRTQLRAIANHNGRSLPWQALALLTTRIPR